MGCGASAPADAAAPGATPASHTAAPATAAVAAAAPAAAPTASAAPAPAAAAPHSPISQQPTVATLPDIAKPASNAGKVQSQLDAEMDAVLRHGGDTAALKVGSAG
jgi:hypothetical protein